MAFAHYELRGNVAHILMDDGKANALSETLDQDMTTRMVGG